MLVMMKPPTWHRDFGVAPGCPSDERFAEVGGGATSLCVASARTDIKRRAFKLGCKGLCVGFPLCCGDSEDTSSWEPQAMSCNPSLH